MAGSTAFIKMDLTDNVRVLATLQKAKVMYPQLVAQVMRTSAIHVLVPAIRAQIRLNNSVFTGEYHSRQDARSGIKSGNPFVEVGAIGVMYGRNLELGNPNGHNPNRQRIREWVRKKLGVSGRRVRYTANLIIHSILTKGTAAHPAIMPAWQQNKKAFFNDVVARLKAKGI